MAIAGDIGKLMQYCHPCYNLWKGDATAGDKPLSLSPAFLLYVVAEQLLQRSHVLIQDNELDRRAVAKVIQHSSCNRRLNIRC